MNASADLAAELGYEAARDRLGRHTAACPVCSSSPEALCPKGVLLLFAAQAARKESDEERGTHG